MGGESEVLRKRSAPEPLSDAWFRDLDDPDSYVPEQPPNVCADVYGEYAVGLEEMLRFVAAATLRWASERSCCKAGSDRLRAKAESLSPSLPSSPEES